MRGAIASGEHSVLTKVHKRSVSDEILDQLLTLISRGELRPGDRVPTEMELKDRFGVGRTSVREALKVLSSIGLIVRRNEGTFVAEDAPYRLLDSLLKVTFARDRLGLRHLFEARRLIEGEIVALAAQRRSPDLVNELRELWEAMADTPVDDFGHYFELDMQFHSLVAEMADNPVIVTTWEVILQLLRGANIEAQRLPAVRARSRDSHEALIDAIARGDSDAARSTLQRSLQFVEAVLTADDANGGN